MDGGNGVARIGQRGRVRVPSVLAEIVDHGEGAVAACAALEELTARIRDVGDGDEALAVASAIEREVKAIKAAAGTAQKACREALSSRVVRRQANSNQMPLWADIEKRLAEGRISPEGVDPDTGEIRG